MRRMCSGTRRPSISVLLLTAVALAIGLQLVQVGAHDPVAAVNWFRDVEPLVRARCASCHMPDGPALPALVSFEDFQVHGSAVKKAVLSRAMPPWSAIRGFGAFSRDTSLSPGQISVIASWIEAGLPRGVAGVATGPAPSIPVTFRLQGTRVLKAEIPPLVAADGVQRDRVSFGEARPLWISGWRFVGGDPTVRQVRVLDVAGHVLWTSLPGFEEEHFPQGTGVKLAASIELIVESIRRTHDLNGQVRPPKRKASSLELFVSTRALRELRTSRLSCGTETSFPGTIFGMRPWTSSQAVLEARVTSASSPRVLGAFALSDPQFPLTYWLREPQTLRNDNLKVTGTGCSLEVIHSGPARPVSSQR
jgi:hypothetical protein